MIISKNDMWYCPCDLSIDDYMNLYFYTNTTNLKYNDIFGYQNMFVTLEIRNSMYKEDY